MHGKENMDYAEASENKLFSHEGNFHSILLNVMFDISKKYGKIPVIKIIRNILEYVPFILITIPFCQLNRYSIV